MKVAVGLLLGLALGAGCRFLKIPAPGPQKLLGAALVAAITAGFVLAGVLLP